MTDIKQQGDLYIIDDANNTLTVDSANTRVGIGNNNPGHALSVTGDGNFTANLSAGSNLFLVDAGNSRITLGTTTAVSGNVLTVSGASNFSDTITAAGTGNSLTISDTLRIAQTGSGLRMTNVGAFDNDGSNNFRVFGTNDLILAANGETGTAITIDATNQDVTISNDLRVGTGAFYINSIQLTATATELNQLSGLTLGTAASANIGDFATAAQGALADTALQVVAVDGITITGDGTPLNPLVAAGGGGGGISIGDAVGSGTAGSLLFVDASTNLGQDNANLYWDNTNNRLSIGTATPSTDLHVEKSGTTIGLFKSTGSHANVRIDRASTSFDSALLFYTGGSLGWRIQESSGGNDLYFIDQDGSPDTARMRFYDTGLTEISQGLTVGGTITQGNSTNAVLVSDANGDIGSASNLQDVAYLQTVATDGTTITGDGAGTPLATTGLTETCMVRLDTSIVNIPATPGGYALVQSNVLPTGPIWDASPPNPNFDANTGLYTVATAGVYRISWAVAFRFTSAGQTQASRIYVNGSPAAQGAANTTGNWPVPGGSILLTLNPGDTVALYYYQSQSGTNLVGDTTSVGAVYMSINKVSV